MYIPQTNHPRPNPDSSLAPATKLGAGLPSAYELPFPVERILSSARQLYSFGFDAFSNTLNHTPSLQKRAGADNVNTTIGVVVGVLLAAFIVGAFVFLYFYGKSIRFTKRKRHRRKSSGSKGSKTSEGGAGGCDPPAAA